MISLSLEHLIQCMELMCIPPAGGNITITVTNLIAGMYDIYLYGHGNADDQNSMFQLSVTSLSYGSEATTNGSAWISSNWQEGVQYVEFTNVNVDAAQTINITVEPGASPYALIAGLQMALVGPASPIAAILTQPTNEFVFFGSTTTFSVVATGAAPLAYQWLFDGAGILSATNSSFSVTKAQLGNAGNYSVIVANAYGSVTSIVATLTIMPQVLIVTQPQGQSVAPGSNLTLSVFASGAPPLAYQWQFDGTDIAAATNSSLSLTNAQLSDAGNYAVIVTNAYASVTSLVAALNVLVEGNSIIDVAFTSASVTGKTGLAATGLTSNDFWNTYVTNSGVLADLEYVDGAPSGAGMTVQMLNWDYDTGAYSNGASDPMYGIYLFNFGGIIDITITNLISDTYDIYIYGHGNENSQNGVYQVSVNFLGYGSESTMDGPGWRSPVWVEGVQYVEFTNVSVLTGQMLTIVAITGDENYAVLSGLQLVPVGPPSPMAAIVTEPESQFLEQGANATLTVVAGGATPITYKWLFNNDAIATATNSTYSLTNVQRLNSGNYSVIVSNAYGSVTSAVAALDVVTVVPSVIDVAFTGASVTAKTGFAATGVTTNDFWNTYVASSVGLSVLKLMDGTVAGAQLTVDNATEEYSNGSSDPMYGAYLYPYDGDITVTVDNLMGGLYDFYLYGHGNMDNQNGIYDLVSGSQEYGTEATTNGPGWLSTAWQEGVQYVEFTNVNVGPGQTVTITVETGATGYAIISGLQMVPVGPRAPNAYIVLEPTNQIVGQGSNATFSVVATGVAPLTYQWLFDNADIPGATSSSYSVTNVQPTNSGNYSVSVSNVYGTVTSVVATLTVFELTGRLIDVAFTSDSVTAKTGFAATGVTAIDYWNTYPGGVSGLDLGGTLPNLKFADGTFSDTGLSVFMPDGPAFSTNGASDPMYSVFLYAYSDAGPLILQVTQLSPGVYNFYLYGHGPSNNLNSIFRLAAGSLSYGNEATTNGPGWLSSVWQEGVQYVEFTSVEVLPSQTITISVQPGSFEYYAVLSGLQIAYLGTPQVTGVARNGDGSVTLNFVGLPNTSARVWAATNLAPPVFWEPIFTNDNVGATGQWQFTDTNAGGYAERFYRFSMP